MPRLQIPVACMKKVGVLLERTFINYRLNAVFDISADPYPECIYPSIWVALRLHESSAPCLSI